MRRIDYPAAIAESAASLREHETRVRGTPAAARVQMLRLLKGGEATGATQVATLVGFSPRHVERWWRTYRTAGLAALLRVYSRTSRRATPIRARPSR
ncbi:MAG: helix-turn-helix domain containing protein [Chloroflexota bacterium]|nr:helix-turn-helix domain containing protein [Chloroflexota bacterium]